MEGKAASSRNSLKHGFTAQEILISREDPAEYASFQQQLFDELQPKNVSEAELVDRLTATLWRVRRVPRFEAAIFSWLRQTHIDGDIALESDPLETSWESMTGSKRASRVSRDTTQLMLTGRTLESAFKGKSLFLKLSFYETRLLRQSQQLMAQLLAMRSVRNSQSPLPSDQDQAAPMIEGETAEPSPVISYPRVRLLSELGIGALYGLTGELSQTRPTLNNDAGEAIRTIHAVALV